jgi:hypothetical protein
MPLERALLRGKSNVKKNSTKSSLAQKQGHTFRPKGENWEFISRALEATGMNLTQFLNECVKIAGMQIVEQKKRERDAAAESLLRQPPPSD